MVAYAPALETADAPNNRGCVPAQNLGLHIRHILLRALALATLLCLMVAASPVYAMQLAHQPHVDKTDDIVALAALLSIGASAGFGFVLVKLQFSPARKR